MIRLDSGEILLVPMQVHHHCQCRGSLSDGFCIVNISNTNYYTALLSYIVMLRKEFPAQLGGFDELDRVNAMGAADCFGLQ